MAARTRKDKLAEGLVERDARNRSDRQTFESVWQEIARYVLPREATFTDEVAPGTQRNRWVLDSTAPRSLELFASFLHTLMNNPSIQWFKVEPLYESLMQQNEVKQWFEAVEKIMLNDMVSQSANTYANLHTSYLGLGAFGTAPMFIEAPGGLLRTRSFHLNDVTVEEDASGNIDVVLRQSHWNTRQMQQRFPDMDLDQFGPSFSKKKGKEGKNEPIRVLHCVVPTNDEDFMSQMTAKDRRRIENAPYASVWVNAEDRITVSVGRYEEFPYMVPRWYKTRGEIYGRSPAMTTLPDTRMANRMMETILRGAEKIVDPPLMMRDGGLVSPVRLWPGGITFTEGDMEPKPIIPRGASRIDIGAELLAQRQQAIREGFFTPLFATPDSPVKTATQVLQEVDERNRAISPMLIRLQGELFHRMIIRIFGLLQRSGRFPTPPPALEGADINVRYVSPLFSSQRQIEALGTLRIIESLLPWAQVDESVLDPFKPSEIAKVVHAGSGAPAAILRNGAELEQVRRARAEQAQQQQQLEQLSQAVEAGAKAQSAQAAMTRAERS